MVRGMLVRDKLARCKRRRQEEAEVWYFANPYDKAARLHLVQVYGSKYGVRLAAEEASAYRIQKWIRKSNLRAKISHLVYKWQYDNSHKMVQFSLIRRFTAYIDAFCLLGNQNLLSEHCEIRRYE